MLTATHILAGVCVGIQYAYKLEYPEPLAIIILTTYGSVAPNADFFSELLVRKKPQDNKLRQHLSHRELLHAPITYGVAWLILRILFPEIGLIINGFIIGALVHLLMDLFAPEGIPLLYPSRERYSIGNLSNGNTIEMMVIIPVLFWRIVMDIQKFDPSVLYNWDGHLFR